MPARDEMGTYYTTPRALRLIFRTYQICKLNEELYCLLMTVESRRKTEESKKSIPQLLKHYATTLSGVSRVYRGVISAADRKSQK